MTCKSVVGSFLFIRQHPKKTMRKVFSVTSLRNGSKPKKLNKMEKLMIVDRDDLRTMFAEFLEEFGRTKKKGSKYISVDGLCELTGLSKTTIYIKSSRKEIPGAKKIGGKLLFDRQVIENWIESGAVKTRSEMLNYLEEGGGK